MPFLFRFHGIKPFAKEPEFAFLAPLACGRPRRVEAQHFWLQNLAVFARHLGNLTSIPQTEQMIVSITAIIGHSWQRHYLRTNSVRRGWRRR